MKISHNLTKINIALLLIFLVQFSIAQDKLYVSPGALELQDQRSLWKRSNNPAGLQIDRPFQYSQLVAGYEGYGGDFNRPQQGNSGNRQSVQTEGNLFIGGYYFSGSFNYVRDNIKNANYNASIIDPLRGMPYIIADLNSSDWNNQHYNLQFRIATPQFNDKVSLGLTGAYKAASGAKQRDIRAENYNYSISVTPGVVYSPAKNHHIGLNLTYDNLKERSVMKNVNVYIYQTYYELMGLGNAISRFGDGSEYNYEGDGVGGALQYHLEGDFEAFLNLAYKVEAEDLKESFIAPRDGGSVLRKVWDTRLSLQRKGEQYSHFVDLTYYNRAIDGIQYVTQRDNSAAQQGWVSLFKNIRSTYSSQRAAAKYSLIANRNKDYAWKITTGIMYEKLEDKYILPNSLKVAENIMLTLTGKKSFVMSNILAKQLLVGAELGYNSNLSGTYNYAGEHAAYPTVTGLEQNDLNYLTSDYISVGIPIVYSQQLREKSKKLFFAKANGQYIHTNSFDYTKHYIMSVHLGLNF